MPIVIYRSEDDEKKDSWIRYFLRRIKNNQNNLIAVVGATGSGKTWTAISICQKISKINGTNFTVDNIVFTLRDLMALINSGKLKKGSCIIFDEPQTSISARDFQTEANKIFNYLLTTFRHRNLNLFFCTPYEDLLDKTARKLFHAKFLMMSINRKDKTARVKPLTMEYNSHNGKFYEKYLRVAYKEKGRSKFKKTKLTFWDVSKPVGKIIDLYEAKKMDFTSNLNKDIQNRLEKYDLKREEKGKVALKSLTKRQEEVLQAVVKHGSPREALKYLGTTMTNIYEHLTYARKKGYTPENYTELSGKNPQGGNPRGKVTSEEG